MSQTDREKWKLLLKSIEFFENFESEELDELIDKATVSRYSTNEWIVKEAKQADSFYVILRGKASIIKLNYAKAKQKIGELNEGDCFGEIAVLLEEARSASVMAARETFLFEINTTQIESLHVLTQLKLYRQFARVLALRLKLSSARIADNVSFPGMS